MVSLMFMLRKLHEWRRQNINSLFHQLTEVSIY